MSNYIEIGSEFEIESRNSSNTVSNTVFDYLKEYNAIYFDSGRSALLHLLNQIDITKIAIPEYMCESVINCFQDKEIIYYPVDENLNIIWDDLLSICYFKNVDTIYLHFFNGYIDKSYDFYKLYKLKIKKNINIIEDTTHSFFTNKNLIGDYCICSLRKWFSIPDGGVLYSKNILKNHKLLFNNWYRIKYNAMIEKNNYLKGTIKNKSNFLEKFYETDELLENQKHIFSISPISLNLLKGFNLEYIKKIRLNNYNILKNHFKNNDYKLISLNGLNQIPLFFTIYAKNRDSLRNHLKINNIYCPVHWPVHSNIIKRNNSKLISMHELSIPIDHRYNENHMNYIIDVFKNYSNLNCER